MKFVPFLLVLFVGALESSALAQQTVPAPLAQAGIETAPDKVLTPAFVREGDYIAVGRFSFDRRDATILRVGMTGLERIRGDVRMAGRGIFVSEAERAAFPANTMSLVFGKYDPLQERVVLLARLEATPENIALAKTLAEKNARLTFNFSADKASYGPGEKITLSWEVQNTSPTPQKIFIGQYALQWGTVYDNTMHSTGSGGSHNRKPEDYKTLAPGEKWTATRVVSGPFPQGEVGIEMTFESFDNFLGSDSNRRQAKERVEGVAMAKETRNFSVQIQAPSAADQKALLQKLASANWSEAMDAATVVSELDGAHAMPEVAVLAKHPWPALRVKALRGLSKNANWTPELRALLFDRDRRVRSETVELIYRRSISGASLSILALLAVEDEARRGGFSDAKGPSIFADTALVRLRDKNIGDLLAARLEKGDGTQGELSAAYILNFLAENQRETRLTSSKAPTETEKAAVLAAWKAARGDVQKPVTGEQLEAEIALARRSIYGDFKTSPDWAKVIAAMQGLKTSFWPRQGDENRVALETLPSASRPDVLRALRWKDGPRSGRLENAPPLRALADIEEPLARGAAFDYLLARAYDGTRNDTAFYVDGDTKYLSVVLLGQTDFARAKPHLETFLAHKDAHLRLGAAVALVAGGDKRGVPGVFENEEGFSFLNFEDAGKALSKITGQTFPNSFEWKKWWQETGSKQTWK